MSGPEILIRLAGESDAPTIAATVERCYGGTYVSPDAIVPAKVAAEIRSERVIYVMAATIDGRHIGQAGLTRVSHDLWELGRTIVEPDVRGSGISNAMNDRLLGEAPRVGARFVMGRMVTSHIYVQRHAMSRGMVPTGLLLAIAPSTLKAAGIDPATQAVSMVVGVLRLHPSPRERRIALRGADRVRCLGILRELGVPARPRACRESDAHLGARVETLPALGITHLRFSADEATLGADEMAEATDSARLTWADIPVEHPRAQEFVQRLRSHGFGWAAYLPEGGIRGEDVLRLQRLARAEALSIDQIQVVDQLVPLRGYVFHDTIPPEVLTT